MIEMSVRAVKRAGEERLVAVLEREVAAGTGPGRLLVTLSRAEAHVIYHELRAERTLPGQTYELMAQVVALLNGKLTAVEIVADEGGRPSAQLRLERADGRSTVPTRAGQALALAVHLKVPLLVAEGLLRSADGAGGSAATTTVESGPEDVELPPGETIEVPEVFLRAFDE